MNGVCVEWWRTSSFKPSQLFTASIIKFIMILEIWKLTSVYQNNWAVLLINKYSGMLKILEWSVFLLCPYDLIISMEKLNCSSQIRQYYLFHY